MTKNPYIKKRKPKAMNESDWTDLCRHWYLWGMSSIRIMRSNYRYRSDCPQVTPDPDLIRFLWHLRKQLRKYQNGRVLPYRRLFHG